jgi:hypothetical protein
VLNNLGAPATERDIVLRGAAFAGVPFDLNHHPGPLTQGADARAMVGAMAAGRV